MTASRTKTYEVTGATAFRGHAPGETFDAELTEDEARRATERGSIRVVTKTTPKTKGNEDDG